MLKIRAFTLWSLKKWFGFRFQSLRKGIRLKWEETDLKKPQKPVKTADTRNGYETAVFLKPSSCSKIDSFLSQPGSYRLLAQRLARLLPRNFRESTVSDRQKWTWPLSFHFVLFSILCISFEYLILWFLLFLDEILVKKTILAGSLNIRLHKYFLL